MLLRTRFLFLSLACVMMCASAQERILWRDPGEIAKLDFGGSVGEPVKPPQPPFLFVREDLSGTHPKLFVRDAQGATWNVKFGPEVKPEAFTWRLARAAGYIIEPSYFVASGQISKMQRLRRGSKYVKPDGTFQNARFQWRDPRREFVKTTNWTWGDNPFRGTKELNGLKVLLMLTSNWDNKDGTDVRIGPNTGVFLEQDTGGSRYLYAFTDWGSTMGNWYEGHGQSDWRCDHFTEQTPQLVGGVKNGEVQFGFLGHHHTDFNRGIKPEDVAWLMTYLGQLTDEQLRAGLKASGATEDEQSCFTKALRLRLEALRVVSAVR